MIDRVPYRVGRLVGFACVVAALLLLMSSALAEPFRKVVVFVGPAGTELSAGLKDALTAQLSGGTSQVVFEQFSEDATTLRKQVVEAKAISTKYWALGVFWLDSPVDKDWLLYLAEPSGDRVLVRRITMEEGGVAAATEAVSVITSESAEALASGRTIGMQPVTLPPEPAGPPPVPEIDPFAPPKPIPPPPKKPVGPSGALASIAYVGDTPAREIAWQSGARFAVGYRFEKGIFLAAGYTFLKSADVTSPTLAFHVGRTPVDVGGGWVLDRPGFRVGFELRAIVDVLSRENVSNSAAAQSLPSSTRPLFLLSPRVRLEQDLGRTWGVFIDGGIAAALNSFSYIYRTDTGDEDLLRPARVRPVVEAGALLFL